MLEILISLIFYSHQAETQSVIEFCSWADISITLFAISCDCRLLVRPYCCWGG